MNVKLQRYIAAAVLLISLGLGKASAQTVYITESGRKYHSKDCAVLKNTKKSGISLKEAIKQGFTPCDCVTSNDKKRDTILREKQKTSL